MAGDVGLGRVPGRQPLAKSEENKDRERIRVVVRVRPENGAEKAAAFRNVIEVVGEEMLVFDPKEQGSPSYYHGKARRQRDISKRASRDMKFVFDRVFGNQDSTMHVYENTTKAVLDGLLEGYNCSVFAYGATGAGKTHTMLGTQQDPGVIFLTMMDLYRRIDEIKHEKTCDIAVSYLEVYNEQIRDLLQPGNFLPVREDPNRGVVIAGLSLHKPHSAEELMHMLRVGNSNRTQHPTDANAESSRSHAVFQVYVRQRDRTANTSADWNVAKMSLIDLAGSERATVTKNRGARFREGANINRSLLALGNCINALAEGKSKGYVPYRNSKLTRLLKDSLGGNCRTVMIAAISPSAMSYEDTYNTLKYANRAKNIKVGLKKNVMSVDLHVSRYVKVIEELRKEVAELKGKLNMKASGGKTIAAVAVTHSPEHRALYDRLSASLEGVFRGRIEIRKEMLELESSERDLSYKIYRKELMMTRISFIAQSDTDAQKCLSRSIESAGRRKANIERRRLGLQSRMNDNTSWLQQVMEEVEQSRPVNPLAELLDANIRMRHLEVELRDTRRQAKYLKRLSRAQEREAQTMEKFNTLLLQTVYNQYRLIKAHGIVGHQEVAQYEAVQNLACQNIERTVAWADQSVCPDDILSTTIPVTPGPSDRQAVGGDFSVSNLLDFPILSCVPITPQRRSAPPTPRINENNPKRTPSSARRRRRTPKKPYMRQAVSHIPTPNQTTPRHDLPGSVQNTHGALATEDDVQERVAPIHNLYKEVLCQSNIKEVVREDDGVFPLQPTPPANAPTSRLQPTVQETKKEEIPEAASPITSLQANTTPPRLDLGGPASDESSHIPIHSQQIAKHQPVITHSQPITTQTHRPASAQTSHPNPTNTHLPTVSHAKHPGTSQTHIPLAHPHHPPTALPKPSFGSTYNIPMKTEDGDTHRAPGNQSADRDAMNSTYTENLNNTVNISPQSVPAPDQTMVLNHIHMSTCGVPLPVVDTDNPKTNSTHSNPKPVRDPPLPPQTPVGVNPHKVPTPTTPVLQNSTFNTASTVTKTIPLKEESDSRPTHNINTGTVTKVKTTTAGSSTVTKCVHFDVDKENNITPPQVAPSVVRSMNFGGGCPSPVPGGMSFADVLKSPAPSQIQRLKEQTVIRSPLASRENLPDSNTGLSIYGRPSLAGCPNNQMTGKASHKGLRNNRIVRHHSVNHLPHPGTDTLRKLGLPSVLDRRGPASGGTPGYMKNTQASSRRYKKHPRALTTEGDTHVPGFPRRIFASDENTRPAAKRGMARSKSTTTLSSRNAGPR